MLGDTAIDTIDGSVTGTITYEITADDGTVVLRTALVHRRQLLLPMAVGTAWRCAHDHAGGYGHAGADNVVFIATTGWRTAEACHTLHSAIRSFSVLTMPTSTLVAPLSLTRMTALTRPPTLHAQCPARRILGQQGRPSTVDKDVVGNYFVRYTAHDAHKNEAEQVTRIVRPPDTAQS